MTTPTRTPIPVHSKASPVRLTCAAPARTSSWRTCSARRDAGRPARCSSGGRGSLTASQTSSSPQPSSTPTSAPTTQPSARRVGVEHRAEVDARPCVALRVRRSAAGPLEVAGQPGEQRLDLDDVGLDPAGDGDDLLHPAGAVRTERQVHDQVDAGGDGGHHEPAADVLAGQQRQRARLDQRLARGVGVQAGHAGQPGVEREQQVEALLGAHLADDQPRRPHPQALLDQAAQPYLAGALQPRLPGLQRHPVGMREPQLEHLLAGHHPLPSGDGGGQAVEQRGLAGLGAAGHQHGQAGAYGRVEELRGLRGQRAEVDQVAEAVGAGDELADVDGSEVAADAVEHHVQPVAAGQHRVDERLGQVEAAPAGLEHPLDQLAHLLGAQHDRGELVPAAAGDEDPAGVVDPDLLDLGVVEQRLQHPQPRDPGDDLADRQRLVVEWGHRSGQAALLVPVGGVLGQPPHRVGVEVGVDAAGAYLRADLLGQRGRGGRRRHGCPRNRTIGASCRRP